MAHTPSSSPKPSQLKEYHKTWWLWTLVGACVVALLLYPLITSAKSGCCQSGVSAVPVKPEPSQPKPVVQTITRELDPERWCDWVKLPGGVDAMVGTPGWRQYQYADGTLSEVIPAGAVRFLGTIRSSNFQIKGAKGTAKITYEVP